MAQPPFAKRVKRSGTSDIGRRALTPKQKLVNFAGWVLLCIAIVVCLIGAFALLQVMRKASVAQLDVVGVSQSLQQQQVTTAIEPHLTGSYFTTDLAQIRDRALSVSWVDRVVVSRAWPNQIRVRVLPRHAIARWGAGRLLSDDGVVFTEAKAADYNHLPIMHGPVAHSAMMMRRYNEINQLFAPLGMQLKALYLTERMTWFMQFNTGQRIIVDQEQTMRKLQTLSQLLSTELKVVWPQVAGADLRYRNGLALQWKNGQAPAVQHSQFVVNSSPTQKIESRAQATP